MPSFLFVFSPAILTGVGIFKKGVNIPVWDDWERGFLFEKYYEGTLDFAYLNGPHIDHRMLFPRLIQLGLNGLTGGNLRAEMFFSYALVVLGGVAMFFLVRRTLGRDSAWVWPVAFLINVVFFSPLQYQNYLWAVQLAIMIPIACLPAAILVMVSGMAWWKKLLCSVALAVFATHSFAHGLLLWPVVFCLGLLLRDFGTWKQRTAFLSLFAIVATVVVSAYFLWKFENVSLHSYGKELGETPPAGQVFERIGENTEKFKRYFMLVIGNPFARIFDMDPANSAKNVARGSFWLFGLGVGYMLWRRRDAATWDRMLPWAAMGMFSICAALLMASGRCELNVMRALLPRYLSLTMFLGIAIIGLAAFLLQRWRQQATEPGAAMRRVQIATVLCVAAVSLQFSQWVYGFHKMEAWRLARLQARASLLYINHFEPEKVGRLDNKLLLPLKYANYLNDRGLIDPPLFEKCDFGSFRLVSEKLNKQRAGIEKASVGDDGMLYVEGHAILPEEERTADGVLWAWRPKGAEHGGWKVFGLAEMCGLHVPQAAFIDTQFGNNPNYSDRTLIHRWRKVLDLSASSRQTQGESDVVEIMAFAMDTDRMELHPFDVILTYDRSIIGNEKRLVIADNHETFYPGL